MFVNPAEWHEICAKMFTTVGVPEEDAGLVADTALTADIRGVASHGSVRLPVYRERIQRGLINPTPSIRIVNDCPTLVHLDGDNGLAQVVDNKAAQRAPCIQECASPLPPGPVALITSRIICALSVNVCGRRERSPLWFPLWAAMAGPLRQVRSWC